MLLIGNFSKESKIESYLGGRLLLSLQQRNDGSLDVEGAACVALYGTDLGRQAAILQREPDGLVDARRALIFLETKREEVKRATLLVTQYFFYFHGISAELCCNESIIMYFTIFFFDLVFMDTLRFLPGELL